MKKLAIISLLSVLILPAQVAFAILPMDAIFAAQVFSNVENATSVEYTLTANLQVDDTEGEEVADLAATLEGAWENTDGNEISSFDGAYVGTILSDEASSGMSSAVLTNERVYFLDTWSGDDTWYYFSDTAEAEDIHVSVTVPSEDEIRDEVFEMFSKGLVETDRMSDHWVDGVLMQKYSYTVNTDVLIDLQDNIDEWSAEEVAEAKAYANEHITATGEIWIDKDSLYPYLINLTAVLNDSEVGYATLELELVFDSFNESLNLAAPTDAVDIVEMYAVEEEIQDDPENYYPEVATVDTDGDGLTDSLETYHQTNLSNPDSDGDGYTDYDEVMNMYDPNGPGQMDSDKDGLGDRDEVFIWYSHRFIVDTDGDGYDDQTEVLNGYDPNGEGRLDSDFDGITNFDEIYVFGTDPFMTDTDKDGYTDGEEIFNGYNPLG